MNLAELQAKIAKHAWEDPAFEAEFVANPKATFEKYLGLTLPANLVIQAHYNTPTELHFVLPKRAAESGELTDDDLDRVAGGEVIVVATALVTLATAVTVGVSIGTGINEGW